GVDVVGLAPPAFNSGGAGPLDLTESWHVRLTFSQKFREVGVTLHILKPSTRCNVILSV
ncbi:unnamed protein product, partial [Rangifer tarandus platyrhynchus]